MEILNTTYESYKEIFLKKFGIEKANKHKLQKKKKYQHKYCKYKMKKNSLFKERFKRLIILCIQ